MNANVQRNSETLHTARNNEIVVCVTCLVNSYERKIYSFVDKTFFSSITTIQVPPNSNLNVCWECKAILDKIKRFRMRALKANLMLSKRHNRMPDPLTTLVQNNLQNWISIAYKPIKVLTLNKEPEIPVVTNLNEEVVENETLAPKAHNANSIEEDPFLLHSEVDIKMEEDINTEEVENCMDIIKCEEEESSSDDEPLADSVKAKTHLVIANHQTDESSDTDSATELPTQSPALKTTSAPPTLNPTSNVLRNRRSQRYDPDASNSLELLSVFASSFDNPELSITQAKAAVEEQPLRYVTLPKPESETFPKPVQYHSGPKLFKYSPQLAIPEMFRNIEPPKPMTYEIRMLTEKQLKEYRDARQKSARERHWQYFCGRCLEKFQRQSYYQSHLKEHDESTGPFQCNICKFRFPTQRELDEHTEEHYRVYFCRECKEEFYTRKSLMRHNDFMHEDVLRYCRICDKKFTNKKELYSHKKTHIETVKCDICNREMKRTSIPDHNKAFHGPTVEVECDICHKKFRGKKAISSHLRCAHGPVEECSYCIECDVTFKSRHLYQLHLKNNRKHRTERRQYSCRQCDQTYDTQYYLRKHIFTQHQDPEMTQCDICKKMFKDKRAVRLHITHKHLAPAATKPARNQVCDICGKTFSIKATLEQHRNSHLNIRPYKCEECGATFSYSGARYTHIKLKHRKKQAENSEEKGETSKKTEANRQKQQKTRKKVKSMKKKKETTEAQEETGKNTGVKDETGQKSVGQEET